MAEHTVEVQEVPSEVYAVVDPDGNTLAVYGYEADARVVADRLTAAEAPAEG